MPEEPVTPTPVEEPLPLSVRYKLPAVSRAGFLTPCEHRYSTSTNENHIKVCLKISDAVGASVGIDSVMCAKCRLTGKVNPDFVRLIALNTMSSYLTHAILGFNRDETEVIDLLNKTYALLSDEAGNTDPERVGRFKNTILELVLHGRISEETALTFSADKPIFQ